MDRRERLAEGNRSFTRSTILQYSNVYPCVICTWQKSRSQKR